MDAVKENTRQTILKVSIDLFAKKGYANVSVRDIAKAVGIKPASLYYHFANKQSLYVSSIEESFSHKAKVFSEVLQLPLPAEERLKQYVYRLTELAVNDEPFRRLMLRELLDGDEQRIRYLAEEVFQEQFSELGQLINEIDNRSDPHMVAISILSMVLHHLDTASIRRFLPGYKPEHNEVEFIAGHVNQILFNGLCRL